ncbi:deoxyribose-phosphate aldolase [Gregarina niphandrodes]|uniref:deoxyribose-phosphate aldolase n=1 Tax=Gregarina niphandrodes TaxID=110365 RepID=A0A023B4A6_GRENI|nr:deoxyribose-phosphate aldolase [Gregarina niphandrodes]EZG56487.1 deoxyribose-phosphate aldolase [Gregarina niphandrodes]|eukprot:XP_011131262.1 deoxyribose-phosphate aldolase [Gregarina niphandrodes]
MNRDAELYLSLLDLTSLNKATDSEESIRELCAKAQSPVRVAAVCVYPEFVRVAKQALGDSGVSVATVINFPEGRSTPEECADAIKAAQSAGADEIDFVIPWEAFKRDWETDQDAAEAALAAYVTKMVEISQPCKTKSILETSQLNFNQIRSAAHVCANCGVDFVKTSTGKVEGGATVDSVKIMAEAVKGSGRNCGVKPSGGIKTESDCKDLLYAVCDVLGPEWACKERFRFGASSVRNNLLGQTATNATASY